MDTQKTRLATLLRGIRKRSNLTRRAFADAIGLSVRTVDNAEYAGHRVLGAKSVESIAKAMKLTVGEAEDLRQANDELSESAFMTKRREHWKRSNDRRATRSEKSRSVRFALVMLLVEGAYEKKLCACVEGSRICALCGGLRALGVALDVWEPDKAMSLLESEAEEACAFFDAMPTRFDVVADDDFGGA